MLRRIGVIWVMAQVLLLSRSEEVNAQNNQQYAFTYENLDQQDWVKLVDSRSVFTIAPEVGRVFWYFRGSGILASQDLEKHIVVLDTLDTEIFRQINIDYLPKEHALLFWDAGIGRVFQYDLDSGIIERLDNSYSFNAFFDHGEFVDTDTKTIYTLGGYGEFTSKDILMYFSLDEGEWIDITYFGDRPNPKFLGDLEYDEQNNLFYYVQYEGLLIHIYSIDPSIWKSTFLGSFQTSLKPPSIDRVSGIRRLDTKAGLLYIYGSLFYDIAANSIREYTFGEGEFSSLDNGIMASFDESTQQWLLVGQLKFDWPRIDLMPVSLTLKNGEQRYYERITKIEPGLDIPLGFWLMLFVSSIVIWVVVRVNFKLRTKPKSATIRMFNSRVQVLCPAGVVEFNEDLERAFWTFVKQLHKKEIHSADFREFDQYVLSPIQNDSQNSLHRKKLIRHINSKLGCEFVQTQKNELDRRYRRFVFRHDLLG